MQSIILNFFSMISFFMCPANARPYWLLNRLRPEQGIIIALGCAKRNKSNPQALEVDIQKNPRNEDRVTGEEGLHGLHVIFNSHSYLGVAAISRKEKTVTGG